MSLLCVRVCVRAHVRVFMLVLQAAIVDISTGEGCIFDQRTVCEGVRTFLRCALHWQTREAEHFLRQSLAWV